MRHTTLCEQPWWRTNQNSPLPPSETPALRTINLAAVRAFLARHPRPLGALLWVTLTLLIVLVYATTRSAPAALTQRDIDAAVRRSLQDLPLQSRAAAAYAAVRDSVVRVSALGGEDEPGRDIERGVGTGVVIHADGTILTSLHVVANARRIGLTFADGHKSDAILVGQKPAHDLAVIIAKAPPPMIKPAALRSTAGLRVGDETIVVGFPFGVGPSVSAGIISGLHRNYRVPAGTRALTNLIQFDASANPGNSGGPLLTMSGDVVGIVAAILSPGKEPGSVGIGFAVPIENAAAAAGASPF